MTNATGGASYQQPSSPSPAPTPIPHRDRLEVRALLLRYASDRSPAVRDEIVERFMPLARSLAMRYRGGSEPIDDLVQVANLGLVKAVSRFDPRQTSAFTAFAVPTIIGELRRHFRDRIWTLRLPRGLQELTMDIDAAVDRLTKQLGRPPTPTQIAAELGLAIEQVLEGIAAGEARRTLSLDAPPFPDDEAPPPLERMSSSESGFDRVEAQFAASDAGLDERERRILQLRFGEGLTQQQISRRLGVSQMRVSRINREALWKLLSAVRGDVPGTVPPSR
jgi:RNA polymerase sigma-B factor